MAHGNSIEQLRVKVKMPMMATVPVQHNGHESVPLFRLHHKTVCLAKVDIYDNVSLGLPDFTTAVFDVIATFETERPYLNSQNTQRNVTCDNTHHVAYLIVDFSTESGFDFVTLTDLVDNNRILREFF